MTKTPWIEMTTRLMGSAAAAGLVFAPIAAQAAQADAPANTRAGDNAVVYAAEPVSAPGTDRDDDDGEGIVGIPTAIAALFATAATAGTIVIVDEVSDDDNDQSPGT